LPFVTELEPNQLFYVMQVNLLMLCKTDSNSMQAPHLMTQQSTKNVKQSRWLNLKVTCHLVNAPSKITPTT